MTNNHNRCTKCGEPIMKLVINDLRIVDFEISGRCPECAAEDGLTPKEAIDSFCRVAGVVSQHGLGVHHD